jgi:predicted RNA binding protein YcfA (HicA-like mRNA interferase family)/predicted RNase H-like HicB family nuclease
MTAHLRSTLREMKVKDLLKILEDDGWFLLSTKGSHMQFKHPVKPGRVTIAGKHSADLAPGTLDSILKQAGPKGKKQMHRFLVVIEKANGNYSAYSPYLPGCIAAGATQEEVEKNMTEAINLHIRELIEDGLPVPESESVAKYVAVE